MQRSWKFYAGQYVIEVPKYSPGVIGLKPIIRPGESFHYMSSTILPQEQGSMEGSFLMVNLRRSEHFEVYVTSCPLQSKLHP
jgi:ApaG protein